MSQSLRVLLRADDPVRRQGLRAMVQSAGHIVTDKSPDVVLCDLNRGTGRPTESDAPVVVLTNQPVRGEPPAGVLPRDVAVPQLDAALRAAAAGLLVRTVSAPSFDGFRAMTDEPPLTPRESEILTLVGQGMSNKVIARSLGISLHTVKFHLEALFAKLDATSRAEAVAKGMRSGLIEL